LTDGAYVRRGTVLHAWETVAAIVAGRAAWALFAPFLLVLTSFPWLDHLIRQPGPRSCRSPFSLPPTLAGALPVTHVLDRLYPP
jgi:hypothetical protein